MSRSPRIVVLAGTNGAGKSSVAGALLRGRGADFFNPDEEARRILARSPRLSSAQANAAAWQLGKTVLERAIQERLDMAFETTLGGHTIPALLQRAMDQGIDVVIWYVGLASVELHLRRVRARVAAGGHDIPEERIRVRYRNSLLNLIRLLPGLSELRVFDNSAEADPKTGRPPVPVALLHMKAGKIVTVAAPEHVADWAKPILAAAFKVAK